MAGTHVLLRVLRHWWDSGLCVFFLFVSWNRHFCSEVVRRALVLWRSSPQHRSTKRQNAVHCDVLELDVSIFISLHKWLRSFPRSWMVFQWKAFIFTMQDTGFIWSFSIISVSCSLDSVFSFGSFKLAYWRKVNWNDTPASGVENTEKDLWILSALDEFPASAFHKLPWLHVGRCPFNSDIKSSYYRHFGKIQLISRDCKSGFKFEHMQTNMRTESAHNPKSLGLTKTQKQSI